MKSKIVTIVLCWTVAGAFISVYDYLVLQASFSGGVAEGYRFVWNFALNCLVGLLAAITGGTFMVKYVNDRYGHVAYWKAIMMVALSFVIVSSGLVVAVSVVETVSHTGGAVNWTALKKSLLDPMHLKNVAIWSLIVAFTQLMLQVNDKFGQGVLYHLITGKYHKPREEKRIFMIVDINESTSIAEVLPQDRYHLLIRDFFADVTRPILAHGGEIYQYVGDAIVISWHIENDVPDNRCLLCYFDMHVTLAQSQSRYISRYGLIPRFKAGLHYGNVIAGEIGIIKKEITYSGDVLNTVSRIQGKCNEFCVSLLTSDELLALLPYEKWFKRIPLGEIELRGKQRRVSVSSLEMNGQQT